MGLHKVESMPTIRVSDLNLDVMPSLTKNPTTIREIDQKFRRLLKSDLRRSQPCAFAHLINQKGGG